MIPINKYLIEATIAYISDNFWTPYISVDTLKNSNISVPNEGISEEGIIVLDVSSRAIVGLEITAQGMDFYGKFKDGNRKVHIPIDSVIAVYALENRMGMALPLIENSTSVNPLDKEKSSPNLKLVEK